MGTTVVRIDQRPYDALKHVFMIHDKYTALYILILCGIIYYICITVQHKHFIWIYKD